jgi:hypothetical protein
VSHALIYSDDAPATRAFLRDVLGWSSVVDEESGRDWLIFKTGPSELGYIPLPATRRTESPGPPQDTTWSRSSVTTWSARGRSWSRRGRGSSGMEAYGFCLTTTMQVPGADDIMIYEPAIRRRTTPDGCARTASVPPGRRGQLWRGRTERRADVPATARRSYVASRTTKSIGRARIPRCAHSTSRDTAHLVASESDGRTTRMP